MILKSLLLHGFKSFPDKTEIRFLGGMTAIVGPNGSGKSNISDAIRWVLGEQSSRSLRGAKMEDVIFGGTQKRGPVGFAEVSLILDNSQHIFRSEYSEIMVTRRYYRSGESEYYLNKKHCRLRDIHELFMDTGLGRDGYSMIGQGRIDEILSLKSEDRREIFEEAAGITKFRYRKEEAERKLAATEDNLVRIRDLYTELENQVGPLEKQAQKAKQYLLLHDELRVLEISLWLISLQQIRSDSEESQANIEICEGQLTRARQEQDALYTKSEQLADEMRRAEVETEGLRLRLREIEQQQADWQSQSAVLKANIQNHYDNIERANREHARQAEQARSLDSQLEALRNKRIQLDLALAALDEQITQTDTTHTRLTVARDQTQARISQLTDDIGVQSGANFQLELEQTAARTGLEGMVARRGTIDADLAASIERMAAEQAIQEGYQEKRNACLQTLASAKNKLAGVTLKAESRRKKVEEMTSAHAALTARKADCDNRVRMLTEMQREYEGFSRAVKMVMNRAATGKQHGIHGPVSSLISVDSRFITAIEIALGAAASNIVVDTADDAKNAIAFLKRSDGGRATFLPIDTIKPAVLHERAIADQPGCFGTADALIDCAPAYRAIVQNLLGRTCITENMDAALSLARACNHRFRIVTLDGQVIQAGGAMTGGSVSKSSGVLSRAGKLRELTDQQQTLQGELARSAQDLAAAKEELAALDYDRKAIEAERARAQEDEARLTALCSQHNALLESVRTRHEALALEQINLDQARAGYENTISGKAKLLDAGRAKAARLEDDRARSQQELDVLIRRLEDNTARASKLRTIRAQNRTEAEAEGRALSDLERLQKEIEAGLSSAQDTISQFEKEIMKCQTQLAQAEQQLREDGTNAAHVRSRIAASAQNRLRIEGEKTAADKQAQAGNEHILLLEREYARLSAQKEQLKTDEAQILNKMWESYELTPTPAADIAVPLENVAQAQKQVQDLKSKMRGLGNVNLDAVDEYKILMERFTFLGEQRGDLERAKDELSKIIEQLTVNMKEIFASEFSKLNSYFGETFREIFGGGHASLQLADTADILNCGIDIMVSPPGKAVKTITLLSGGEKAFVAIALYFAILKLRPTPFCVLDEIEAALDDVNVARFAQYIRRLTDKTQFIVITHRRGTMEEADMLYGVTMQEHGVSRLLMLNLTEAEKQLGKEIK